jgi:Lipopolysaccharide-assembly
MVKRNGPPGAFRRHDLPFHDSRIAVASVLLTICAISGCSIRFAANGTLPSSAKTVCVDRFENHTRVPGVNDQFTLALKEQISQRDRLVVVDDKDDADLILRGAVIYYGTYGKTSNSVAEPLDYADTLSVSAELVDRKSGKMLWSTRGISSSVMVPVVTQAIIPTTPEFLHQNLRGQDLLNMPDIQVAATQQATGQNQLMTQEASELYTDMAWGI